MTFELERLPPPGSREEAALLDRLDLIEISRRGRMLQNRMPMPGQPAHTIEVTGEDWAVLADLLNYAAKAGALVTDVERGILSSRIGNILK